MPTRYVIYRAVKDGSVQTPGLGVASRLDESGLGGSIMKALCTRGKKTAPLQPEPDKVDTVDPAPAEQPADKETGRTKEPVGAEEERADDTVMQRTKPTSSKSEETEKEFKQIEMEFKAPGEDEGNQPGVGDDNFFNGMSFPG
ncbi:hypothetical protein A6M21_12605 [Desulfotomaculum copahuensis]|uniref:Uncharacterized protein n=1 Tax=Desulfotomaculum copahuensis TaxID=1838280 RepID=A0A1B7LD73_9FIRM|nr:hypothetical protein A6M21_12605 [Desulfotomaculum copahuensis]